MRNAMTCPKCRGRRIWRVERFRTESDNTSGWVLPVVYGRRTATGGELSAGTFDAWICATCGYTEWYASGLEGLTPDPDAGVHLIDAASPDGPLR